MPDIPPEAWAAVDAALDALPQPGSRFERDRWRTVSRTAVYAAAPVLAGHVAGKITAHMEAHGPQEGVPGSLGSILNSAWRRHFRIAAQVAALAFSTKDDIRRAAAQALRRGDFAACSTTEDGTPVTGTREDENRD